jgi:hypothetical protein
LHKQSESASQVGWRFTVHVFCCESYLIVAAVLIPGALFTVAAHTARFTPVTATTTGRLTAPASDLGHVFAVAAHGLTTPASDLGHVFAVAAYSLTALTACIASFV